MLAVLGPWLQQRQGAFGATGFNVTALVWCIASLFKRNVVRLALCTSRDLQGIEYTLDSCQEPHLFVICKQERQSADAAVPVMFYYILDGSVYQTPTIHGVLSARLVWACPVCRALVKFYCSCITKVQVPIQQAV